MNPLPLLRESIQPRLDGIQANTVRLREFGALSLEDFTEPEVLERAHYHLRLALEGVFNISAHILARFPGNRETEYKRIARKMGELGIVKKDFADKEMVKMAGYRNRLTHFYSAVKAAELHEICKKHLCDIETFLHAIQGMMKHPGDFGLTVE